MQNSVIYKHKGIAKPESKEYVNAIFEFNQAIMINSNDAETYLGRGMAYKAQEKYSKAISDLNKAIEIDPNYVQNKQ
jgi:tetratricopeptide (TPR) repeat protein